eukprot:GHVL01014257.1.p1 GENE.GHVL01014257.1~~GHVL01014257.1.p1  ORF type:complete len:858 (+),score=173.59 GHVL01014257.1:103-2676(+)
MEVICVPSIHYIWLIDQNTNIKSIEIGPKRVLLMENQKVEKRPERMVVLPPQHYCIIMNPVKRDLNNTPLKSKFGEYRPSHGEIEVRISDEWKVPFPLYPGEEMHQKPTELPMITEGNAALIRALRDFDDKVAGEEWLIKGPSLYFPRKEEQLISIIEGIMIGNADVPEALRLRAIHTFFDEKSVRRSAGTEWLVREEGNYIIGVFEEFVRIEQATILVEGLGLHLKAINNFKDVYNIQRTAGQEWIVTQKDASFHIPDVDEEVIASVNMITLTSSNFAFLVNADGENGFPKIGLKKLLKGPQSFYLKPTQFLENGIENVHILEADEALLLSAKEDLKDGDLTRNAGSRWMIYGPQSYVPPLSDIKILQKRRATPLDEREGLYIRDVNTGKVRAIIGGTYMLKASEELWKKEVPAITEELLKKQAFGCIFVPTSDDEEDINNISIPRDKTRVISFQVPANAVVQAYDYGTKTSRVCFGPDIILLQPEEELTVLSLSGGQPKQPNVIKTLALSLGPDYMTDKVIVVTSDHTSLSLVLAYNWYFEIPNRTNDKKNDEKELSRLFSVKDFIGDVCKTIAASIRGLVATKQFDEFHRESAKIIKSAVFGPDNNGEKRFLSNGLVVSSVDIKSVEPVDKKTLEMLQKSVQLAIEITSKSQEAAARHQADKLQQKAQGELERHKFEDDAAVEKARQELLGFRAKCSAVSSSGQTTAEANAQAEAALIRSETDVKVAEAAASGNSISAKTDLTIKMKTDEQELRLKTKESEMAMHSEYDIYTDLICEIMRILRPSTVVRIANALPELQARLLECMNWKGMMVTDPQKPVDLHKTATAFVESFSKKSCTQQVSMPLIDDKSSYCP